MIDKEKFLTLKSTPPPSPCIKLCRLDKAGYCVGCLRTGEEIGRWPGMSTAEQYQLLDLLKKRRQALTSGVPIPE